MAKSTFTHKVKDRPQTQALNLERSDHRGGGSADGFEDESSIPDKPLGGRGESVDWMGGTPAGRREVSLVSWMWSLRW